MWNTVKSINSYLSGPDLPPWDETNWHFFETEHLKKAFDELDSALEPSKPITTIRFIGPYKIGKTSALNYYRKRVVQSGVKFIFHELNRDGRDSYTKMIAQWFTDYANSKSAASTDEVDKELWKQLGELTRVMYVQDSDIGQVLGGWQEYWENKDLKFAVVLKNLQRQRLDNLWSVFTTRIIDRTPPPARDCWENFFQNLQRALNAETSLPFRRRYFTDCWEALKKCGAIDSNIVLVFWEEFEGDVPGVDDTSFKLDPTLNAPKIKYICVGREPYQGVQTDVPNSLNERLGSPGFEGKASPDDLQRQSTQKTIQLHAFTRDDALRFVKGEGVVLPFIHKPVPYQASIPDQVGYHPALLQIMCWGILSEFYIPAAGSNTCWDDCLEKINEIKDTISVLLDEEEKKVILNAHRTGINAQFFQRLSGKGVVL